MAYDERSRIGFARHSAPRTTSPKARFGGLAFLYRDRMCCGIVGSDLMVRVPDDEFDAVMRGRHVRPMDFMGKSLRGSVYLSPPAFRTRCCSNNVLYGSGSIASGGVTYRRIRWTRSTRILHPTSGAGGLSGNPDVEILVASRGVNSLVASLPSKRKKAAELMELDSRGKIRRAMIHGQM